MKLPLFSRVTLSRDIPEEALRKGDVATVVEHYPVSSGDDGYSLEVFNAVGDTVMVTGVPESAIEAPRVARAASCSPPMNS